MIVTTEEWVYAINAVLQINKFSNSALLREIPSKMMSNVLEDGKGKKLYLLGSIAKSLNTAEFNLIVSKNRNSIYPEIWSFAAFAGEGHLEILKQNQIPIGDLANQEKTITALILASNTEWLSYFLDISKASNSEFQDFSLTLSVRNNKTKKTKKSISTETFVRKKYPLARANSSQSHRIN